MKINILCKVLSCRENLIVGGLILLVAVAFGSGELAYADPKLVNLTETGGDIEVEVKDGDGIDSVDIDVQCKDGRELYYWSQGWTLLSETGKDLTSVGFGDLEVGGIQTERFLCINKGHKP